MVTTSNSKIPEAATASLSVKNPNTISKEKNSAVKESLFTTEAQKLYDLGLVVTSSFIGEDVDGKKIMSGHPKSFESITKENCLSSVKPNHNCMIIITGERSGIIVIDIDNKVKSKTKNGYDFWNSMIEKYGDIKTWKAKTGNNGFHYYFKYNDNHKLLKTKSDVTIGKDKYTIDIRNNKNGIIYAPPTNYKSGTKIKTYEWINSPYNTTLLEMPKWLFDILNNSANTYPQEKQADDEVIEEQEVPEIKDEPKTTIVKNTDDVNTVPVKLKTSVVIPEFSTPYVKAILSDTITEVKLKELLVEGIKMLNSNRNNNYDEWINLGILCYQFGKFGIALWIEFSKQYANFKLKEIKGKLKTFYFKANGWSLKTLFKWVTEDKVFGYKKYLTKFGNLLKSITMTEDEIKIKKLEELYHMNDIGYVEMYYNEFRDSIVYACKKTNSFYVYNNVIKLWEPKMLYDIKTHFLKNIKDIIDPLIQYYLSKAKQEKIDGDVDAAKKHEEYAKNIDNTPEFNKMSRVNQLVPIILSMFYIPNFMARLNIMAELIPVKDGVVNLRSGQLVERMREHYFTFELNVKWRGLDYATPNIDKFMNNIMLDNKDMIKYLQNLLGYSITGYVIEQKFVILWGNGANGKGILMNLLKILFGDFYQQCISEVIMMGNKSGSGGANPGIMQLMGSRLAFVDETESGGKLNEAIVKTITGDTAITARQLYCDLVTFEPTFQFFVLTNHKPEFKTNPSIERRIVLIPFLAEFKESTKMDSKNNKHKLMDKNLGNTLKDKIDEFLVWIVKGSVNYFKNGLGDVPEVIQNATNEYMQENDEIQQFLDESCVKDVNCFVYTVDLYNEYINKTGNKDIKQKGFTKIIQDKGYEFKRKTDGRGFNGLKLKDNNKINELDK